MAHNYYQQPQYYHPQNIYQQLGAQQPQQQPGGLALVPHGQQPTQSLVQRRLQSLQAAAQASHAGQQQVIYPGQQLQIAPRVGTVHPGQQQVVQYQASPVAPLQTHSQYTYPQQPQPPAQIPASVYAPWSAPQQPQQPYTALQVGVAPAPAPLNTQVPPPQAQAQRRPLPQPTARSDSLPQVPTASGSSSPTRSRPLPAPTPGPSSSASFGLNQPSTITNPSQNTNSPPKARSELPSTPVSPSKPAPWSRTPSPVKSTPSAIFPTNSAAQNVQESPKRGRTSPPKFSAVPITSDRLSSANSSPSPPSSVSSLSPDSFSGSPSQPARNIGTGGNAFRGNNLSPTRGTTAPANTSASDNTNTNIFAPSPSISQLKSALSGPLNTPINTANANPKPPGQKFVPVWKRTLPDVLPPLLPTPPPNVVQQAQSGAFQRQLQPPQPPRQARQASPTRQPQIPPPQARQQQMQIQPPRPVAAPQQQTRPPQPQLQQQRQQQPQQKQARPPQQMPMPPQPQRARKPQRQQQPQQAPTLHNQHQRQPQPPQMPPQPQPRQARQQPVAQQQQRSHPAPAPILQPPPPIPSHSKPRLPQASGQWGAPHQSSYGANAEEEDDEEDDGEQTEDGTEASYEYEEEEEQTEDGTEASYEDEEGEEEEEPESEVSKPPPSPQYGIRDLPPRSVAFPLPGPPPQPPAMNVGGGKGYGPRSIFPSSSSSSGGGGSGTSMTMRFAAGEAAVSNHSRSGSGGSGAVRGYDLDLDDVPPPRSEFVLAQGNSRRALPAPENVQAQSQVQSSQSQFAQQSPRHTQDQQRRPQSEIIHTSPVRGGQARPQSQMYHTPLKGDGGGGSSRGGEWKAQLQRTRSFGSGRELPRISQVQQEQGHRQQQQQQFHYQTQNRQQQSEQRHHETQTQPQPFHQPQPQRQQPQAPASIPQINVIESPAPVGGRDKRADIGKMETADVADVVVSSPVHSPVPIPLINILPEIEEPASDDDDDRGVPQVRVDGPGVPSINVSGVPQISVSGNSDHGSPRVQVYEVPGVSVSGPGGGPPSVSLSGPHPLQHHRGHSGGPPPRRGGLTCGGCGNGIVGRIVNAMGQRWHPGCFRCTVCNTLLEHVSSYEWEGKAYCHLDYHENFAPKCYSCKTPIYEERFISLDDPALGKRAYHEQHFFCAECGDPFLAPSIGEPSSRTGELTVSGDGDYASDDVGFTVYRGHPYCEACHVRLRLPKCKRCKRSIRDGDEAVEALGGKWCWGCFVCKGCERPFDNPSFFQRGDEPYCEQCFSIILRNEV